MPAHPPICSHPALSVRCEERVLFMDTAPHGLLFPRCKVIVHHGTSQMTGSVNHPSVIIIQG